MDKEWTGARPLTIPMLPKEITMDWFRKNNQVQEWIQDGNIPLGFSMATTEARGYRPKDDPYFLIVDGDGPQAETVNSMLEEALKQFEGKYQRVVMDGDDLYGESHVFDLVVGRDQFAAFMGELSGAFEERLKDASKIKEMLIFIPDVPNFSSNSAVSEAKIRKLIKEGYKVGIHFIFRSQIGKIDYANDVVSKAIKVSPPKGLFGSRVSDQNLVNVGRIISEPYLGHDEYHYFSGRNIDKVRLLSE
jgi:S-DNA-T family DNA segregation ATPase FtsK/SpoIIIE